MYNFLYHFFFLFFAWNNSDAENAILFDKSVKNIWLSTEKSCFTNFLITLAWDKSFVIIEHLLVIYVARQFYTSDILSSSLCVCCSDKKMRLIREI